jgi:hypothetical protein
MKKITLILVLSAILISRSNAQDGLALGLRYGIGINSISSDPSNPNASSRVSILNAAAIVEKGISEIFALQGELGLSDKGFSLSQVDYSYKYLGLNVLPKVRFGNDVIEGFGFLGAGIDMNLSASGTANGQSMDMKDVSGMNLSGIIGGGAAYKLSSGKLFFDARYNMGLSNTYSGSGSGSIKVNQIGLNIGYLHNF